MVFGLGKPKKLFTFIVYTSSFATTKLQYVLLTGGQTTIFMTHNITPKPLYHRIIVIQARGRIIYNNNEVIRMIVSSIVSIFLIFGELLIESGSFLAYNYLHSKGNYPSKFQLISQCQPYRRRSGRNKQSDRRFTDIPLLQRIDQYKCFRIISLKCL